MGFIRRLLVAPLVFLNFVLYIAIAAIAGWALNEAIDRGWEVLSYNPATFYFVIFALIAGVVGIAAKFSGAQHLRTWHHQSLVGSNAAAFIAWLLTLLAMGLAWKEISLGGVMSDEVKALEALVIIVAITQFLYLLGVGAGAFRGEYVVKTREPAVEITSPPPAIVKE